MISPGIDLLEAPQDVEITLIHTREQLSQLGIEWVDSLILAN